MTVVVVVMVVRVLLFFSGPGVWDGRRENNIIIIQTQSSLFFSSSYYYLACHRLGMFLLSLAVFHRKVRQAQQASLTGARPGMPPLQVGERDTGSGNWLADCGGGQIW